MRDAEDQSGPLDWMCSVVDKSSSLHVKINPHWTTRVVLNGTNCTSTPQDIHPQFNKSGYWIVFLDYLSSFPTHTTECLAHSLLIFSAGFVWLSFSHEGWITNHCPIEGYSCTAFIRHCKLSASLWISLERHQHFPATTVTHRFAYIWPHVIHSCGDCHKYAQNLWPKW